VQEKQEAEIANNLQPKMKNKRAKKGRPKKEATKIVGTRIPLRVEMEFRLHAKSFTDRKENQTFEL